jgi:hypothetical protein
MTPEEYAKRQAKVKHHKVPEMVMTLKKPQVRKQLPSEHEEQCAVISWCNTHPIAKHIFAIPNGSYKSAASANRFKAEGLRAGVPDLFLPEPRRGYHGLFIEMKRTKGAYTSQLQDDWLIFLASNRYCTQVANGADEAIDRIKWYLTVGE